MEYIDNSHKIAIEWTILRGSSKVKEDFRRAKLVLILLGPEWRYYLEVTSADDGVIKTEIPEGLLEGVYGIKAIWIKDDHHPHEGMHYPFNKPCPHMHDNIPRAGLWHPGCKPGPLDIYINSGKMSQCRKDDIFGITALAPECENPGGTITIKMTSSVATYGYDGMDAYELALMHGKEVSEEEWLESYSSAGGVITDLTERVEALEDGALMQEDIADDLVTTDPTMVLSANQGAILKSEIDRLWDKINECCGNQVTITISPTTGSVGESGGNPVFFYTVSPENAITSIQIDAGGLNYSHDQATKKITLNIPANTTSLSDINHTLTVKGMVNDVVVASASAIIKQAAHTPVVLSRTVTNTEFSYNTLGHEVGDTCRVNTLAITMAVVYDLSNYPNNTKTVRYVYGNNNNEYTPSSLIFSKIYLADDTIKFDIVDPNTGELACTESRTAFADYTSTDDVIQVHYHFDAIQSGVDAALDSTISAKLTQAGAGKQISGYTGPIVPTFSYPNNNVIAYNNGNWTSPTETIKIQRNTLYNDNTFVPRYYAFDEWEALGGSYVFDYPSGVDVDNNGRIKILDQSDASTTKTYVVKLTATIDGVSDSAEVTVTRSAQPAPSYGTPTINITRPGHSYKSTADSNEPNGYEAITVTSITQSVDGATQTYNLSDSVVTDVTWEITNGATWVTLGDTTSTGILAILTENTTTVTRTARVRLTLKVNGVTGTLTDLPIVQESYKSSMWYGFSSTTPTTFENRGTATEIVAGARTVTVTTNLTNQARCHYVILASGSSYSVSSITNALGIVISTAAQATISDSYGRQYTMWYYAEDTRYINTSTNFTISR